jgi:hypothetical protein
MFFSSVRALQIVSLFAGLSILLTSCEYYALRFHFSENNIFNWNISRTIDRWTLKERLASLLDYIMLDKFFTKAVLCRGVIGAILIFIPFGAALYPVIIIAAFILSILVTLRTPFGLDGSDQMVLILLGALLIASINERLEYTAILFIIGQLFLVYGTSGVAKLVSPEWRSGRALVGVMKTTIYGNEVVARFLQKSPFAALTICWAIMIWEISFPLCVVVGRPLAFCILLCGIIFHAINAVIMGLNNFFLAFVAGYPLLIWAILSRHN